MSQSPVTVDQLILRARVSQLLEEFFSRVDRAEPVADLLTEDSEFREAKGRTEVTELLLSLAKKRADTGRTSRHFSSNIAIDELADGRYRVRSLVVVLSLDTQPEARGELLAGDHDDIVEFDADGVCRFVKRTMVPAFRLGLAQD
ncbi:MAG TPA: hypothetical protein VHX38_07915 [Pseudonocardiaceae bacterium]|jgi:hypothetical protein|nr:hypothetical protein [Pseudonocardiaceae bacterium]